MDTYVPTIIFRTACPKGHGDAGEPCWMVQPLDPANLRTAGIGICNARALKAGFVGKITHMSLFRGKTYKKIQRHQKAS